MPYLRSPGAPTPSRRRWVIPCIIVSVLACGVASAAPATSPATAPATAGRATAAEALSCLPGFKVEMIYNVPKLTQGSWINLTVDPKGRLIAADQGPALYRITPGAGEADTRVEKLSFKVGQVQGFLFAYGDLYVDINGGGTKAGVWRLHYNPQTDDYDDPVQVLPIKGGGEHGPHALALGPDGLIYVLCGNASTAPDAIARNPMRNYAEDLLLPRQPDGRGFMATTMAPGGFIARFDPRAEAPAKTAGLFCSGFRNPYDMAFNRQGELFVWDADMENDVGAPWYRPTRICLATSAAEFGWRNGSGKWPEYYPDSHGPVANTGLSSPTGVTFGYGAKFPAKYQHALFGADWAYGILYAFHITPDGAGYKATFERFLSGRPLALTDVVIGTDGAMYLIIGGRNTQSAVYRVRYIGSEPTTPVISPDDDAGTDARALRHKLESFHGRQDPAALDFAWEHLASTDPYLPYAARVAVEWQDLNSWLDRALAETRPAAAIELAIALSRCNDRSLQPKVIALLNGISARSLSHEQLIALLRAYGLCFIRMGKPDESLRGQVIAKLDPLFPAAGDALVNRELCRVLVYLEAPSVIAKSMALLAEARTQEDQFFYTFTLRTLAKGWTIEQRKAYFSWFNLALQKYKGGSSLKPYLEHTRDEAAALLSDTERAAVADILKGTGNVQVVRETTPRKFVRNWQMEDLLPVIDRAGTGRSFARGKAAFDATGCIQCHKFGPDGGLVGPDITGVGQRFGAADVLESILLPSKVISDQFANTDIKTRTEFLSGYVTGEDEQTVTLRPNMLLPETVTVKKADILRRQLSKLSPMPEGLVDTLSQDEILDLIAYLRSGGNPADPMFAPAAAGK